MKKGMFITIEGGEGCGKTTHSKKLSDWMNDRGLKHVLTKEPGGGNLSECQKIKSILMNPENDLVPMAELFLFLADRAQHVEQFINKELEAGHHVISDRFIDSTRAYQVSKGIPRDRIDTLLSLAIGNTIPDLTILLDVDPEIGLRRAKRAIGGTEGDRFENEDLSFHKKVRNNFRVLSETISESERIFLINTNTKSKDKVFKNIVEIVSERLWEV